MSAAVETVALTKRYGGAAVVDQVSLRVEAGEIYAFLGLNGAGKTTTMRMVLGMLQPSGGEARVFGVRVTSRACDVWADVGHLVETASAYHDLSVRQNLEVTRRLKRIADREAVDEQIEQLGLGHYADRRAGALSLGNLQRLGIARAMLGRPRLLVLDEPVNGLDPVGVVEIRDLLRSLARRDGVAVLLSSHLLGEVARIADRVGVIHRGRLIEELGIDELDRSRPRWLLIDGRDRPRAAAALARAGLEVGRDAAGELKLSDGDAIEHPDRVADLLAQAGVPPTKLIVEEEDLEEHFLSLVAEPRSSAPRDPADATDDKRVRSRDFEVTP